MRLGDTLGIVAPAGPVRNLDKLERGLARLGGRFALRIAPSLREARAPSTPSYLAADDEVRSHELDAMIRDPEVRGILLARGGYGLMRILPALDAAALRADPKPIIGFSDATALLAWAHAAGVRGIHGPLGVQMDVLPESDITQLVEMLTEPRAPGLRPWTLTTYGTGTRRGPLVTGNLTLVSMLVGTPWEVPLDGSLALIEEVGERPYELDRYLTQLILTGQLSRTAALVVGDLVRCADANPATGVPEPADAALRTILERAGSVARPVAVGAPIGHGERNEPVPFGAMATLDLDRGTLSIDEPAVA